MPKPKILIVDDEAGIRKVLGISLADRGYAVLTAENANDALLTFAREQPEIVLTDIKMPGMDGIELLRRLKQDNPDTEVVVITGHGDMDLAIKSLKYEATDFITKPIEDTALDRALQKSHERVRLRDQLRQYTENLEDLLRRKSEHLAAQTQSGAIPSNLFEDLPGYVTVHGANYHITAANSRFKDDFAFDPRSGAVCYELIQGSKTPCEACPVAQTFADAKSHQSELAYKTKAGKDCHLFAWTTPLRERTGKVGAVMLMATDISPIMDMRDHLSSLGLMIGSVSHSIKGMLTGLDGGLYMLDRGFVKDDADQVSEGLDIVKMMVGRIKNMVLDILYYAKERDLVKSTCLVEEFVEETASIVRARVEEAHLELICDFSEALDTEAFTVDGDQLRSALVNILENAVDACMEKGDAVLPQIHFRAYLEDTDVVFEIEDNGVGMSTEVQSKIFTLFFSSKSTQGTGIGLFITRKIIHQHGGRIMVTSQPGEGTLFRISIPKG